MTPDSELNDGALKNAVGCAALSPIGRNARLDLRFERRGPRTVAVRTYAEPPIRVGHVFEIDDVAYVILVCSGPGVFAGDHLTLSVEVGPGARVILVSQAALQVHPSAVVSPATSIQRYEVEERAELHAIWDPIIPFTKATFVQRIDIRVAPESTLLWSDAMMAGRVSRGERWSFESLSHELRFTVGESLRYLERYRLEPSLRPLDSRWIAGGSNYFGTLLTHHSGVDEEAAADIHRCLAEVTGVDGACALLEPGLLLGRLAATCGASFTSARVAARSAVLSHIMGSPHLMTRKCP